MRKITESKVKKALTESIKKVLGSFKAEDEVIEEMARVGFINGKFEVYVHTNDAGNTPHVHIRDTNSQGKNFETCVMLEDNKYFLHGKYKDTMNKKLRQEFNEFMHSPSASLRYENNYDFAVEMWNANNSQTQVQPQIDEYGHIVVPDYQQIDGNL